MHECLLMHPNLSGYISNSKPHTEICSNSCLTRPWLWSTVQNVVSANPSIMVMSIKQDHTLQARRLIRNYSVRPRTQDSDLYIELNSHTK